MERIEQVSTIYLPNHHGFNYNLRRIGNRKIFNIIFYVLRTGAQWKALDATGICHGSTAHIRYQDWRHAGVFSSLGEEVLKEYYDIKELDWEWLSMDGAITKVTLGGGATGCNPTDRGKTRHQRSLMTEAAGILVGLAIAGANCNDM
jgi:putative transposase